MSQWLDNAIARAEDIDDWLSPQRHESLALLRRAEWPSRKTEAWKYTPLIVLERAALESTDRGRALERADLRVVPKRPLPLLESIPGLDSIDLVLADGQFLAKQSSNDLSEGVRVTPLRDASVEAQARARQLFGAAKPTRHLFGLVNDVLARDGLLIEIAAGTTLNKPLRIVHLLTEGADAHARVLVHLGADAKAAVMEQVIGNAPSFNTSVAEYIVGARATLEHYRFALQTGGAMAVGGSHFNLGEHSELNSTLVGFGSALSRLDTDIRHGGEYALARLNAIYLLDGEELFDLHSTVEHAVPHGTTEENVRGIVAGRARAVFNGRIHIHRHAQKTVAALNNRNLLLSDKATLNTKPELEIYADDVRCSHGATVAEIDKAALYYLQSRGISRKQAQMMLNFGFINALVEQMPNQHLADWLRPQLRERFAGMAA
jgi:Fe-S cluster assembly protein SufD